LERAMGRGVRVFAEYTGSIAHYYQTGMTLTTRYDRLVYVGEERAGLSRGGLLDDQCNQMLRVQGAMYDGGIPILEYTSSSEHDQIPPGELKQGPPTGWGLWIDRSGSLMIASFRLCNYIRARFSPAERWTSVISNIV